LFTEAANSRNVGSVVNFGHRSSAAPLPRRATSSHYGFPPAAKSPQGQRQFASQTPGATAVETVDLRDLVAFVVVGSLLIMADLNDNMVLPAELMNLQMQH
jgi:hypothetical protein